MNNIHIQQIGTNLSTLSEGPVYDEINNSILWIDIVNALIIEHDVNNQTERKIETGSMIGSFAIMEDGNFIAALQEGIAIINRTTGDKKIIASPEVNIPSNRFNDGKCSPDGRFWAGSMSLNETDPSGSLYSIDKDFKAEKLEGGLTISNGLCWSLNKKYFYFIDTPTLQVVRYDYTNGNISNKKTVITIDAAKDGYPDGMTIDADGNLWIAHWGGWQVACWNPTTGEKMTAIQLPVSQVTSICFGGEDFSDMFISSARRGLTSEQLESEPLAGATFRVSHSGFRGLPFYRFKNV
ncbi:MAG: SMP-30/gluconolactonase/LRE family protein [Bacteroidetes bacterium]|nr:SMP-30/gluconolactonase/LRE family protein [Bacteroidota bacterium]